MILPNQNSGRPRKRPVQHEAKMQMELFDLAKAHLHQYPILRKFFHHPAGEMRPQVVKVDRNGRMRKYSPTGKKLKAMGAKSGIPDNCLPVARRGYLGLYIELKYDDNDLSEDQQKWKGWLEEEGYLVEVCWTVDDAWGKLIWYLTGPPTKWLKGEK